MLNKMNRIDENSDKTNKIISHVHEVYFNHLSLQNFDTLQPKKVEINNLSDLLTNFT